MFRGVSKFKTSLLTNIQSKNNLTNNSQQLFRKASTVSAQAAFTDIEANRKVSSIEEQVNLTKKPEELQDRNKPFLEQKKASHDIIFGSHGLRTSFVRPLHKSKVMLGASTANLVSSNYHRGLSTAAAVDSSKSTTIPDFSAYKKKNDDQDSSRVFSYLIVGSTGALTAVGAKSFVTDFLANMGAAADVLALAKVEVDLTKVPEGKNLTVKWRGKPVFIRHRTPNEIEEANSVQMSELKDPQLDSQRTKKPEWLVMLGVCTHLGCVPIGEAGDYGGWYCPCHGSHYDISGRIRKGPAPLNLEVPDYDFTDENTLVVG